MAKKRSILTSVAPGVRRAGVIHGNAVVLARGKGDDGAASEGRNRLGLRLWAVLDLHTGCASRAPLDFA